MAVLSEASKDCRRKKMKAWMETEFKRIANFGRKKGIMSSTLTNSRITEAYQQIPQKGFTKNGLIVDQSS